MLNNSDIAKPDAVIVLANLMDANGILNADSAARAEKAVEIFQKRNLSNLVTCGWPYRRDSAISVADAFKLHIISKYGISPNKIITELNSRDTVGDAFFTKINIALPLNWTHICIVTSSYHVARTREIFNFIYGPKFNIEVYGAEVIDNESTIANELVSLEAFRITFSNTEKGNDFQILQRLRELHPFYNGEVFDKI